MNSETTALAAKVTATVSNRTAANVSTRACRPLEEVIEASSLFIYCTGVSTSLSSVWGQQLLPKCIHAKACQLALPTHSKGQSVSGGVPVGGCKVRLVGGWPGWNFLTLEPASQQDQTSIRVNHYLSHKLKSVGPERSHFWCRYNKEGIQARTKLLKLQLRKLLTQT